MRKGPSLAGWADRALPVRGAWSWPSARTRAGSPKRRSQPGFPAGAVRHFAGTAAAAIGIRDLLKPGDTLLFKASRGMELERVEAAALAGLSGCGKRRD
jgi:hypothetical protein